MYAFNYQKVKSVADAAAALGKNPDAKLLAGGQTLIASMKLRLANPGQVVDLSEIAELKGIKASASSVTIGAMTRHAEVASSADVKKAIPALAALALMPFSSGTSLRSRTWPGFASRSFIEAIRVWPPASSFASGFLPSAAAASATDFTF